MTHSEPARDRAVLADMAAFPEMNPGPVIRTELNGTILLVNAAARDLFGPRSVVGTNWLNVCHDIDQSIWKRTLEGEDMLRHESAVAGRVFTFTYRRPANIESVFIYGNDITDRKRAEERLGEQAALIAEMARFPEMNPGPVFRADRDARIVLANEAARSLFGGESLIGRCWKDLCPGLDDAAWEHILASAEVVPIEAHLADRFFIFAHRRTPDGHLVFIYGNDVTLLRAAEDALRHSEKMATLGTLAAGVAHELNNPAAAATRGANQLRGAFAKLQDAFVPLSQLHLSSTRAAELLALVQQDRESAGRAAHINPLTRSDMESDVETWLEEHGIADAWEIAPALVSLGYDSEELSRLAGIWGENVSAVVGWIGRAQPVLAVAREIEEATRRISEIVGALKTYSFLGQAPVRPVDVIEGLDNTLIIMRSKLKEGVTVEREYAQDLPRVQGYGSELNQVWTNIIDNAVDAMGGRGRLVVRAQRDGADAIVVEIEDNGPGMPESVRQRVFDPFFTTKEPGKGTGLGLSTSRNIVVKKHRGTIDVTSRPGCTRFIIRLPLRQDGTTPAGAAPEARTA